MKYIKVHKNMLVKGLVLLFLIAMLLFPSASFKGASSGLLLWFHNILPNLLPFIILSNLMVRLNITKQISRIFYPLLGRLFRISCEGCYPIIIGFLSGIPMGAKSTADLVAEKKITLGEGQFLLSMCNNASPMFIIGYIAITQLKLLHINYVLFSIIYGSAILSALIYRHFFSRFIKMPAGTPDMIATSNHKTPSNRFSFDLLDSSIMNGFEIVTKIGGYIILFSILAQIIKEIGPETSFLKAFLMGTLEITTGISQVCNTSLDINTKIVLVSVITSFGGLSGIAQTKSVLGDTRLSINSYIIVKLISALISLLFSLFYVNMFHIA
ncbi:MAG: transporter [Herbinix sp.]|nr:transporter [Herbinix sp.]